MRLHNTMANFLKLSCLLSIAVCLFSPCLYSQEGRSAFKVEIESVNDLLQRQEYCINIFMNEAAAEFAGFDFKIAYNVSAFLLRDITAGSFVERCAWEYFSYRPWPVDSSQENYPSGIVRIIGYAEYDGTGSQMPCYEVTGRESLATLHFQVLDDYSLECTTQPIRFYWTGCGDNKIYSRYGDTVFISSEVIDYDSTIITKDTLLPTFTGAPGICLSGIPSDWDKTAVRSIDFVNGFAGIICAVSIRPGDLNLNGVMDMADVDVFLQYFIMCGFDGLQLEPERQAEASDVNGDGNLLTVEDFVCLIRHITGEAPPCADTTFSGTVTFYNSTHPVKVASDFDMPVGAVHLAFYILNTTISGVVLREDAMQMDMVYAECYDTLNVLIYSVGLGTAIPARYRDLLEIYYSGEKPELVYCKAAGYFGESVDVTTKIVQGIAPTIGGDCHRVIFVDGDSATACFYAISSFIDTGAVLTWSVEDVSPEPDGDYSIEDGLLTFFPEVSDRGKKFDFLVRITDRAGLYDECMVTFDLTGVEPFEFAVDVVQDQIQGHKTHVSVTKRAGSEKLYGFDFLFGYNATALAFVKAVPGELFDMNGIYQWEYFTYRYRWNGDCGDDCPSGLLRVVGIAETNDGPHHPLSYHVADDMVLFTLDFLVSNDRTLECTFVPIRFYWIDCGDNAVAFCYNSDSGGLNVRAGVSLNVYSFDPSTDSFREISDGCCGFPTYSGVQDYCLESGNPRNRPVRLANFYNGGIDVICIDSIECHGDINLNGIPHEIHDLVIFRQYFLYGLAAFTINTEGQVRASDVNRDGIPLGVEDYIYLYRIIVGDASPYSQIDTSFSGVVTFVFTDTSIAVNSSFEKPVGALHLVFYAPDLSSYDVSHGSHALVDDTLRIFTDYVKTINIDISFTGGKPELLSCSAGGSSGERVNITTIIEDHTGVGNEEEPNLPTHFALYQNYPNPFNLSTAIRFDLPMRAEWRIDLFNIKGQKVRSFNGSDPAGIVQIHWDGSDSYGETLPSGIYFYRLKSGSYTASKKMILLK